MKTRRLSEIADVNPPLGVSLNDTDEVSFVPMAAFSEISASVVTEEVRQYGHVKKGFTSFKNGDVLFAKITPCFENGKIGLAQLSRDVGLGSTEFHVIRAKPGKADPRFLHHFLRLGTVRLSGTKRMTGSAGQRRVPKAFLESLAVPAISLGEQRRIAAILDKAEELRAKRRAAIALLDQLPQAIFIEMFGDPVSNPKGWPVGSLTDPRISVIFGGGTPSRAVPSYFEGKICWATSKDIKRELIWDTEEHVTAEAVAKSATKLVPKGTLLVVVKSKILARKLPLTISQIPICFGQDLKGIVPSNPEAVHFLFHSLKAGERWLLERARGINTEGLTLEHLRDFPLSIPPTDLQGRFGAKVEAIHRAKAAHQSALGKLDSLIASLQATAFKGEF